MIRYILRPHNWRHLLYVIQSTREMARKVAHPQSSSELSYAKPNRVFTAFSWLELVSVPTDFVLDAFFPNFSSECNDTDGFDCSLLGLDTATSFTCLCEVLLEDKTCGGSDGLDSPSLGLLTLWRFGLISTMFFKRSCCLIFPVYQKS